MKKVSLAIIAFLISGFAHAQFANYLNITQRNPTDTGWSNRLVGPPPDGWNGFFYYDDTTNLPAMRKMGTGFVITWDTIDVFNGDYANLTNRPTLATVATTGVYDDLTGKPALFGGAYSELSGVPSEFTPAPHTQAFSTITSTPTTLSGYGITDAYPLSGNPSAFVTQSGARSSISLTTTGTSGAATYNASTGVLNVPSYTTGSGTVTSVSAGSGLSGGSITTSGTISMPNVGTAGTYSSVTTDAQGRVTAGTNMSLNDSPGRSIVTSTSATGFQVSASRPALVCYEGNFQTTSTIGGPAAITVFLETALTNSTTPADWTIKAQQTNSNTITLAVVLNQADVEPWSFCRVIPAGVYVRIRSGNVTGTATASINSQQQETTF